MTTTKQSSDHEHIEFTGAYTARRGFKKCGVCLEMYQSSDAIDEILHSYKKSLKNWVSRANNDLPPVNQKGRIIADIDLETKQAIEKLLLEPQLYIWERVKLETDTVKCECGDKWSDSDLADIAEKSLTELQSLLNKTGEIE